MFLAIIDDSPSRFGFGQELTVVGQTELGYLGGVKETLGVPLSRDRHSFDPADAFHSVPYFNVVILKRGECAARVVFLLRMVYLAVAVRPFEFFNAVRCSYLTVYL